MILSVNKKFLKVNAIVFVLFCMLCIPQVYAQVDWENIENAKRFGPLTVEEQRKIGLVETGLEPRFPDEVSCPTIASPFGSRTRFDGSYRTVKSNNGYHGGMDISLEVGTPLLAAADGEVINVGTGGRLVGNVIWMQHAPEDTGFEVWTYTKYQHLDKMPELQVGDRFSAGDVVAISGLTGTTGGRAFGEMGYPHLHMNVYASPTNRYKIRGHKVKIKDRYYVDPVAFYKSTIEDGNIISEYDKNNKIINVGVKLENGEHIPGNTRKIWPVYCERK